MASAQPSLRKRHRADHDRQKISPHCVNEPLEPRNLGDERGNDHPQSRGRYEHRDGKRACNPRGREQADPTYDDKYGRERLASSSYRSRAQPSERNQRNDLYGGSRFSSSSRSSDERGEQRLGPSSQRVGDQGPHGDGRYEQDRDGFRGGMPSNRSSQGVGGSTFEGYRSHGPHPGKGAEGYKRPDEPICDELTPALERDGRIDASEIEVSCNSGVVQLTGKFENRAAKRDAATCVEDIYVSATS